jgi:hypothetical protein
MMTRKLFFAAVAAALVSAAGGAVNPNGSLTASDSLNTFTNNLLPVTPGSTYGYNFGGATGSFSSTVSANGYYYADYLINVTSATAESVTTTLNNLGGVTNLSERIYGYNGTFLGDAAAGTGILQVWSNNYPLTGATVSIISPTSLTAGQYVVELRGTTAGSFGGTLSVTPVPEPDSYAMLLAGLGLLGFMVRRRGSQQA